MNSQPEASYFSLFTKKQLSAWNSKHSPLLKIPTELHLKIFSYVLGHRRVYPHGRSAGAAEDQIRAVGIRVPSDLFLTCKKIHTEALPFLFPQITYCFNDRLNFTRFFNSLTLSQRRAVQRIWLALDFFGSHSSEAHLYLESSTWKHLINLRRVELRISQYLPLGVTAVPKPTAQEPYIGPNLMYMYHEGHASVFLMNLGNSSLEEGVSITIHDLVGPRKNSSIVEDYVVRLGNMILNKNFAEEELARQKLRDKAWAETQRLRLVAANL